MENYGAEHSYWRSRIEDDCETELYDRRYVDEISFSVSAPSFLQPSLLRENPTPSRLYLLLSHLTRFQIDCRDGQVRCCHHAWCFLPLQLSTPPIVDKLTAYGHDARATSHPSVGRRTRLPRATPADDVGYIQSVTSKLAEEGKDNVLVMHSYGSVAGRQSRPGARESRVTKQQGRREVSVAWSTLRL